MSFKNQIVIHKMYFIWKRIISVSYKNKTLYVEIKHNCIIWIIGAETAHLEVAKSWKFMLLFLDSISSIMY